MPTLQELIAAQKNKQPNQAVAAEQPAVRRQVETQPEIPQTQTSAQTSAQTSPAPIAPKPSNPFAALAAAMKSNGGGKNENIVSTASDASNGAVTTRPARIVDEGADAAQVGDAPATAASVVEAEETGVLDDIDLEIEEQVETETGSDVDASAFNHPAMAEALSAETVDAFRANVKLLYDCFDAPELVGNALRNILRATRAHPEYCKILAPEDLGLMVRALRQNYGIVASSKAAGKTKSVERKKAQARVDDLLGDLGNLNI